MITNELTINVKRDFAGHFRRLSDWNGYRVYAVAFPRGLMVGRILIKENDKESLVMTPEEKRAFDRYILSKEKKRSKKPL